MEIVKSSISNDSASNGCTQKCWKLNERNEWVRFPQMIEKRCNLAMAEGMGKIFVVGGYGSSHSMYSLEWIDVEDGKQWKRKGLPFLINDHCISKYNSTHLLLTGGYEGHEALEGYEGYKQQTGVGVTNLLGNCCKHFLLKSGFHLLQHLQI